ncbi:MAG: class I SAM-dependent methyltransferase [Pseudomonadota bacterium]
MTEVNEEKLMAFVGQILGDLGGAYSVALVRMGDKLGLYKSLFEDGPATAAGLAERLGLAERYVREWCAAQAASNYIEYDPQTEQFSMTPEKALVFAVEDSPVYMQGGFENVVSTIENEPKVVKAFKTGEGVDWGDQAACMFCAVARFFRPGYVNNLVQAWLPALDGVVAKLEAGGRVADIGCGHGHSTLLMAAAYPNSEFTGYDYHGPSIAQAREHAEEHGLSDAVSFEEATAQGFKGGPFDLVTAFDCIHDMGDPVGACRRVRENLAEGGTFMLVEPMAGDALEENLNPVGRLFYSASTSICVPTALAQDGKAALGAQAGEKKLTEVLKEAGFTSVRRATETPFNMVLEARA